MTDSPIATKIVVLITAARQPLTFPGKRIFKGQIEFNI
jgi:hypothetical protein